MNEPSQQHDYLYSRRRLGRPAQRRGGILIGRELHPVIGQVATAHGTKCIKEDGRDSLHQLYYGTGPAKKSGNQKRKESRRLVLPREDAKAVDKYSRRERWTPDGGRRQEGSCCTESYSRTPSTWLPRLSTSTAGENGGRQTDGDKKARAAQRATQGRHLHGYQGCRQVQQERTADGRRRMADGRRWTANDRQERRQEGSCCAESCLRMPRELATVKKKDS